MLILWMYFKLIRTIILLLPVLTHLIKGVEHIIPGRGKGEEKLDYVRVKIEEFYTSVHGYVIPFDHVWRFIKPIITFLVKSFNLLGVFKKAPKESSD